MNTTLWYSYRLMRICSHTAPLVCITSEMFLTLGLLGGKRMTVFLLWEAYKWKSQEKDVFSYDPIRRENYAGEDGTDSVSMSVTQFLRWGRVIACLSTHVSFLIIVTGSGPEVCLEQQQRFSWPRLVHGFVSLRVICLCLDEYVLWQTASGTDACENKERGFTWTLCLGTQG